MRISESEPSKNPSPSPIKIPAVAIGFLTWAYIPVVISLDGGLKGMGVPLALRNVTIIQASMAKPNARRITDSPIPHKVKRKTGMASHLSTQKEAMMKSAIMT